MRPTNSKDRLTPLMAAGRTPTAGFGGGAAAFFDSSQPVNNARARQMADRRRMQVPGRAACPISLRPSDFGTLSTDIVKPIGAYARYLGAPAPMSSQK